MAKTYKIAVVKGDGVGNEVICEALKVLDAVAKLEQLKFEFNYYDMGGIAIDLHGKPLPDHALEGILASDALLFGAIGGAKWDGLDREIRPETGLLQLRKALGAFANIRPALAYDELLNASTLKPEIVSGVDLIVVRELTGGIYFGSSGRSAKRAFNTMEYSKEEIVRITKVAFELAMTRDKRLCSIDKANVLEVSQFWRDCVNAMAKDYPEVQVNHLYIDNATMQLVKNPKQFDVILSSNIFGDILSDEAAMVVGSIGLLPSASIGGTVPIFEPVHGSAPDIAGQNIVNPIATIASAAMMLKLAFKAHGASDRIHNAIKASLKAGYRTQDLAAFDAKEIIGTKRMGDVIVDFLGS